MRSAARATTVVMLALVATSVGACNTTGNEEDTTVDPGDNVAVEPDNEAVADPGNKAAVEPGDEECDERHFGDYKKRDDFCWDPPSHYCAQGGGGAITYACDPVTGICCGYSSTCIPCGFVNCATCTNQPNPRADCPDVCFGPIVRDPVACRQPDMKLTICYKE